MIFQREYIDSLCPSHSHPLSSGCGWNTDVIFWDVTSIVWVSSYSDKFKFGNSMPSVSTHTNWVSLHQTYPGCHSNSHAYKNIFSKTPASGPAALHHEIMYVPVHPLKCLGVSDHTIDAPWLMWQWSICKSDTDGSVSDLIQGSILKKVFKLANRTLIL